MIGIGQDRENAVLRLRRPRIVSKILLGAVAAASIAGSMTVFAGAHGIGGPPATFADRFAMTASAADCSGPGWPYFAPGCLRHADGSPARAVRVISLDRR